MFISSKQNEHIKYVRRLYRKRFRDKEKTFFVEGVRLLEEALVNAHVKYVLYTEKLLTNKRGQDLVKDLQKKKIPAYLCKQELFSQVSDTENSQGVLGVVKQPNWDLMNVAQGDFYLAVDQIQDPGNLGAIWRTAASAGVDALICITGTVDLFNPKVIRASMGAVFKLPCISLTITECVDFSVNKDLTLVATDLKDAKPYYYSDLTFPVLIVVGNEGSGVDSKFLDFAYEKIYIPMFNNMESLNVSIATSILLYETVRQRTSE